MTITTWTFTLRAGVSLRDAAVYPHGSRFDVDEALAAGGGSIVTTDKDLASALMALRAEGNPLFDVNGVETPGTPADPVRYPLVVAPAEFPVGEPRGLKRNADGSWTSTLVATRVPNTMVIEGDSITAQNQLGSQVDYSGRGFAHWGNSYLGRRLDIIANTGVSGTTTAQILARFDADVIARNPGWVSLLAGRNDVTGGSNAVEPAKANILAMLDKADAASIRVLLGTITPDNGYDTQAKKNQAALNDWIRTLGRSRKGLIVADYAAAVTDPSTGGYVSGYSFDGTHPSQAGAVAMGKVFAAALAPFVPAASLLSPGPDPANLLSNGRFIGSGVGNDWIIGGFSSGPTYTSVPRTDGVAGSWKQITVANGTGGYLVAIVPGSGYAAGDKIQALVEYDLSDLDASAGASTQGFTLQVKASSDGGSSFPVAASDVYWDTSFENQGATARSGVLMTPPITLPAGVNGVQFAMLLYGGGKYKLDRASVRKVA